MPIQEDFPAKGWGSQWVEVRCIPNVNPIPALPAGTHMPCSEDSDTTEDANEQEEEEAVHVGQGSAQRPGVEGARAPGQARVNHRIIGGSEP